MNEHSRSIDIRHHAIRQDYIDGEMRIGRVGTQDNTSDTLTKNLQPPLYIKHTKELNINQEEQQTLTNCATKLTSNYGRPRDDTHTASNRCLPQNQQLPLSPSLHTDRSPIMTPNTNDDPHIRRQSPSIEAPTGTVKNATLASSRKTLKRERSSAQAITRVMIDLNISEKASTPKHTKCPRHSSTSSSHSTR
jgi:hypothetical protein